MLIARPQIYLVPGKRYPGHTLNPILHIFDYLTSSLDVVGCGNLQLDSAGGIFGTEVRISAALVECEESEDLYKYSVIQRATRFPHCQGLPSPVLS